MTSFCTYISRARSPRLFLLFLVAAAFLRADEATSPAAPPAGPLVVEASATLDAVMIYGRSADLIGEAASSSQGRVGARELAERPFLRRGELLEVVPGVVITQHSGGGKANQYFLRGFNLDHGTDFGISVEGMPVNMRSHAHGQGYADINFIIPETVQQVDYEKGPFFPQLGDFSAAGAAQYQLFDTLRLGFLTTEIGENSYARFAVGNSFKAKDAEYTAAFESTYENGPSQLPEHFQRYSSLLERHWERGSNEYKLVAMGYYAKWQSTDQIPLRAIEDGRLDRFGNVDPTDGGKTQRDSLSFTWQSSQADAVTRLVAYAIYYELNLYSDFSYFLNDPVHGDQFNQADQRGVFGLNFDRSWDGKVVTFDAKNSFGFQFRDDIIQNGLHTTERRNYLASIRNDHINEGSIGFYGKSELRWSSWFRSDLGLRGDFYRFRVKSDRPENSATRTASVLGPKLGLVFGPWRHTEYYVNAGQGFHSNDARGVTTRVDPASGNPSDPVTPLARVKSLEGGMRTSLIPGLVTTTSVFLMDSQSELVLAGDDGSISPTGATRRYGVEFANFYRAKPWLAFEGDVSFTHARYRDNSAGGYSIPNSISTVVTGSATVDFPSGFFGSLRLRYFGPQPLIENNSVREPSSIIYNGRVGYRHLAWEFTLDVLNILNRKTDDIEYYYTSRLPGEPAAGVDDVHLHPNEPRQFRVSVSRRF